MAGLPGVHVVDPGAVPNGSVDGLAVRARDVAVPFLCVELPGGREAERALLGAVELARDGGGREAEHAGEHPLLGDGQLAEAAGLSGQPADVCAVDDIERRRCSITRMAATLSTLLTLPNCQNGRLDYPEGKRP
ncbi:hypothetical protein [Streptomyces canus]|uniref:hypothetical protein n=1 Tax=Streptomyces canus TaxID=58343 RepID=UPI0030E2C845